MELRNSNFVASNVKRGEIYYFDLIGRGSVQGGRRPCVVLSNDINNKFSSVLQVCPLTTQTKNNLPVHLDIKGFGLSVDSTLLGEQLTIVEKKQISSYIGEVNEFTLKKIEKAIKIQLQIIDHIDGVNDILLITRMDKVLKTEIINTLKDIRSLERVIATTNKDSLRRLAIDERGLNLDMLEKICKENGFDYKDFYEKYNEETVEKVAIR